MANDLQLKENVYLYLNMRVQVQAEDSSFPNYDPQSLGDNILVPIERIHNTGSDLQDRINRL